MTLILVGFLLGMLTTLIVAAVQKSQVVRTKRPALKQSVRLDDGDYILTFDDGSKYRGACTVWNVYPSGERCSTETESWLSDVETKLGWEREAPVVVSDAEHVELTIGAAEGKVVLQSSGNAQCEATFFAWDIDGTRKVIDGLEKAIDIAQAQQAHSNLNDDA